MAWLGLRLFNHQSSLLSVDPLPVPPDPAAGGGQGGLVRPHLHHVPRRLQLGLGHLLLPLAGLLLGPLPRLLRARDTQVGTSPAGARAGRQLRNGEGTYCFGQVPTFLCLLSG